MVNKVNIDLSIKGVLEKYGLDRKYIASSSVSDTFDTVTQEVITVERSDIAGGTPSVITGGVTFDVGDVIYVENTSTDWPVEMYVYDGVSLHSPFTGIKAQQGIALIATGINVPQLSIESSLGTITVNLVVFRSSF
jgi:hypothetical protein